jgi:hypothetical protein
MTVATTSRPNAATFGLDDHRPSWQAKRQLIRQLRQRDEISARLAELDRLASILSDAADLIRTGWLQHSWFAYRDDQGRTKTVTAYNVNRMKDRPVVGACLVGAVVQAGGGVGQVRTQPVQRALDLTWHTLYASAAEPIRWNPAPQTRMHHVQQLTRWNDDPSRTAPEAEALLRSSASAARSVAARLRGDLAPQQT